MADTETPLQDLMQNLRQTNRMIEFASRESLAEALFIFALEVAHYRNGDGRRYEGRAQDLQGAAGLDGEQAAWISGALDNIAMTLAIISKNDNCGALH